MKGLLWLVVVLAFSSIASAQQEKLEIFGGYSHMQLEGGRQNKSGWNASVAYRLRGPLSLVADASGYYKASDIPRPIRVLPCSFKRPLRPVGPLG